MKLKGISVLFAHILSNLVSPPVVAAVFGFIVAWKDQPSWLGILYGLIYATWMCIVPLGVVIYLAKIGNRIYILHCFEKKSAKTGKSDLALAKARLKRVLARLRSENES